MSKGIIFSTEMVQTILDGRKTQTRRTIKPDVFNNFDICCVGGAIAWCDQETGDFYPPTHCARYGVGDVLYVKETWAVIPESFSDAGGYTYRAAAPQPLNSYVVYTSPHKPIKWKPSIHMPRKAARIWLKITGVKAERLHDISDADCCAEGIDWRGSLDFRRTFKALWERIHGKGSWLDNPWVWVYEFERCEKPEVEDGEN